MLTTYLPYLVKIIFLCSKISISKYQTMQLVEVEMQRTTMTI